MDDILNYLVGLVSMSREKETKAPDDGGRGLNCFLTPERGSSPDRKSGSGVWRYNWRVRGPIIEVTDQLFVAYELARVTWSRSSEGGIHHCPKATAVDTR